MINQNQLHFGQRMDLENWLVEPWWVNDAVDVFKTWDLKNKKVLEFGAGNSSFWLANKCKEVVSVEANEQWFAAIKDHPTRELYRNLTVHLRVINEGDASKLDWYTDMLKDFEPDIIVNDGILRTEICQVAVDYFANKPGGILVCDNWHQDYVWISPKAEEIMKPFRTEVYTQRDHTDHSGNPWKTAIFYL